MLAARSGVTTPEGPNQIQAVAQRIMQAQIHLGPLPDPDTLKGYEDASPGCAAIIISEMRQQAKHRRFLESLTIGSDVVRAQIGQFCGFSLAGFMIWEGAGLLRAGRDVNGFEAIGIGIASVVAPFLWKSYQQQRQLAENRSRLTGKK